MKFCEKSHDAGDFGAFSHIGPTAQTVGTEGFAVPCGTVGAFWTYTHPL